MRFLEDVDSDTVGVFAHSAAPTGCVHRIGGTVRMNTMDTVRTNTMNTVRMNTIGDTSEPLLHICTREDWDAARSAGALTPPSLTDAGFVHLSTPD